jgi:mono/diheme cytochrome c family protein
MTTGCTEVIDLDPLDDTPPVESRVRPPAISGGTLTVLAGNVAVAADPDRDVVYVVDLDAGTLRHAIVLEPGDEPGRVEAGADGVAFVSLRGAGQVATLDLQAGTVVARRSLCPDPRGLAYDADAATLHVACADGALLHAPDVGDVERELLDPDLRDPVLVDGQLWVSSFRAADLRTPAGERLSPLFEDMQPHVAWRTRTRQVGDNPAQITMLHQLASVRPVPIDGSPGAGADDSPPPGGPGLDGGGDGDLAYGGGGGFCQPGIATTALSLMLGDEEAITIRLPSVPMAVDAAVSPDGQWLALAVPSSPPDRDSFVVAPLRDGDGCNVAAGASDGSMGQITSVDFTDDGGLVMLSREPAQLVYRAEGPHGPATIIDLGGESRFDSGHEIFHRATGSGLSCASCHPEGGDDGHVWLFTGLGARRTQALDVGLADTAPFHWDGDMEDFEMLVDEVLSHRMGGERQSTARRESFTRWLFAQQLPPARTAQDADLVAAGAERFGALGCATCHAGDRLMSNETVDIGGAQLQVPSLRRISLRPPFMHDGRSATLEDAVRDMIQVTRVTPQSLVIDEDVAAIAAYLRTQ